LRYEGVVQPPALISRIVFKTRCSWYTSVSYKGGQISASRYGLWFNQHWVDLVHIGSYFLAMATLAENISSLSVDEKFDLLDAIWGDLEAHPQALSSEQEQELDRRIAAYEKNLQIGTSWEQVKAGLPKR
jgi:putative addiction module component (TIGR02574 family)